MIKTISIILVLACIVGLSSAGLLPAGCSQCNSCTPGGSSPGCSGCAYADTGFLYATQSCPNNGGSCTGCDRVASNNASYCNSVSCVYSSSTSLSTGAIIGIAVGVGSVVLITLVIVVVLCVMSSKKKAATQKQIEEFQAQQLQQQGYAPGYPPAQGYPAYPQPTYAAPPPPAAAAHPV
jgi:hypothetical protein